MNYFRCTVGGSGKGNTVTVTCAEEFAGLTITLSKTGKTYTKTCPSTAPYVVTYYGVENGTYTVSCIVDGETYSETVIVQDISCVLNYGFTWQTWVDTASQLDSSDYDSLDEVLADEKALRELFLEHACVDYMASMGSSNEDLETVINNDLCAKWINNSDYALDFLGANTVIKALMDTADKYGYGEWALIPQVPTMTSATPPFGEVLSSGYTSSYYAYYAFDGVTTPTSGGTNRWIDSRSTGAYIGFHFTEDVKVRRAYIKCGIGGETTTWKIQYSSTGNSDDWHDASDVITFTDSTEQYVDVSIGNAAYWRLYGLTTTANSFGVYELQFYAWAPKGNVPVMTSNTAPYGTASASTQYNTGFEAWRAFDGLVNGTNYWASGDSDKSGAWLQYTFTNPVCVRQLSMKRSLNLSRCVKTFTLKASNDGSTWVDLGTYDNGFSNPGTVTEYETDINNNEYYLAYRIVCLTSVDSYNLMGVHELQFYGRELKVSVPTMTSNTAPYGVASASTYYDNNYLPYKAFDRVDITSNSYYAWMPASSDAFGSANVSYDFGKMVKLGMFSVGFVKGSTSATNFHYKIQGSTDGTTWEDITQDTALPSLNAWYNYSASGTYRYFRLLYLSNSANSIAAGRGWKLQFYGLDYSEKEFEVGTTKKWLYDHGVELETFTYSDSGIGTYSHDKSNSLYVKMNNTSTTNNGTGGYLIDNTIDFSAYSDLYFIGFCNYGGSSNKYAGIGVGNSSAFNNGYPNSNAIARNTGEKSLGKYNLDISSINGNYYVGCGVYGLNGTEILEFSEIWLE